jgi:dUTP pyrophosphatase
MSSGPLINYTALSPNAKAPIYKTDGAAGADLSSAEGLTLAPGEIRAVGIGIAFEVPDGFELQVRSRSGLSLQGIVVVGSPDSPVAELDHPTVANKPWGTVDSDFRGEVKVILENRSKNPFEINVGDRIAQGVVAPVVRAIFVRTNWPLSATARGEGGFNSTGVSG